MKEALNFTPIITRYDLTIEAMPRHGVRRISEDLLLQRVADFLVDGDEEEIPKVVTKVLNSRDPLEIINKSLIPGMKEVSRLWEIDAHFLPQVMLSSDAMIAGVSLCEQKMGSTMKKKAKGVTHTAEGDILDLSKIETGKLQLEQHDTPLVRFKLQDMSVSKQRRRFCQDYAHKPLDVFQRRHAVEEFGGVGICLAIAKRIGSRHGEGTIGRFTLPSTNRGLGQ